MMPNADQLLNRSFDEVVAHAADQAEADDRLRYDLIRARKQSGLTQSQVAEIVGVTQPTVAAFEHHENDPRLSTLRRYAVAVGVTITHDVESFDSDGWVRHTSTVEVGFVPTSTSAASVANEVGSAFASLKDAADSNRTDFALAA